MALPTGVEYDAIQCIPIATFDPSTLTGTYQALNGTGFADNVKIMEIYNGGNVGIDISFDGVTDHLFWPTKSTLIVDFQTNHANNPNSSSGTKYGRKGQIIYGKTSTSALFLNISGYR
jgi:hypothetical protein